MIFNRIDYWFRVLKCSVVRVLLGIPLIPFTIAWFSYTTKEVRLRRNGRSKEMTENILDRYYRLDGYKKDKWQKDAMIYLTRELAELSEKTGVPQWDLRDKVNKDFHLDI